MLTTHSQAGYALAIFGPPLLTLAVKTFPNGWPRPYSFELFAITTIAAALGGRWPGVVAIVTTVPLMIYLGIPIPLHWGVEVWVATALLVVYIVQDLQRTRARAMIALERERRANEMKDQFLATLSHELRTPLTVVLGYVRMLQHPEWGTDRDRITKTLRTVERNAKQQLRLVEDLLDVSRIARGHFTLDAEAFDLATVVCAAVDSLREAATTKDLHMECRIPSMLVDGDSARVQQVVWNLVSNAVKFTPADGCVGVYGRAEDAAAVLTVVDSGEGIDPAFLPHVFERFTQYDMSTTRRHGGMGLGLAIVKEVVTAHGGAVTAQSDGPGKGATFTVTFPLAMMNRPRVQGSGSAETERGL